MLMQIYYSDIETLHQKTMQLKEERCPHCQEAHQQVSHGFVYKKQVGGALQPIGKRIFCSNRHRRTGCGRTTQLYVASIIRYLHYLGTFMIAFIVAMMKGLSVAQAYHQVTRTESPRHAYRWMNRLMNHLSFYRSLLHQPCLIDSASVTLFVTSSRRCLLASTFEALLRRFNEPLCSHYQQQLNRSFLP
jgi:hypothetical protein